MLNCAAVRLRAWFGRRYVEFDAGDLDVVVSDLERGRGGFGEHRGYEWIVDGEIRLDGRNARWCRNTR